MKKAFIIILCAILALCSAVSVYAVCPHNYESREVEATCLSRAFTEYTCSLCGDSYKEAIPLYEAPQTCYMALDGDREGDMLNVSVYLGNNPGFWANRVTLYYNSQALEAVSAENGQVWGDDASVKINGAPESGEPYIRFYCQNSKLGDNTNSGVLFTVSFAIKGDVEEWGLELNVRAADNINYNSEKVPFSVINVVSDGYADHNYGNGTVVVAPSYDAEGVMKYSCINCEKVKEVNISKLPCGDINADGVLDMRDTYSLKLRIADITMVDKYDKNLDMNGDLKVNAKDLLILKKQIASAK